LNPYPLIEVDLREGKEEIAISGKGLASKHVQS